MNKIDINEQKIDYFLNRAVENFYPNKEEFKKKLQSGKRLTAYLGIDPTGPFLHLGHAIAMKKLRQLQEMGHRVILLIGDFTAMIGDPTDKTATRKKLTREQVLENAKNYKKQAEMILDMDGSVTGNSIEIKFNSEWLGRMNFTDVLELASHFTVQQMLERDMFKKRMSWRTECSKCHFENYKHLKEEELDKKHDWICKQCGFKYTTKNKQELSVPKPVYLHEFLYPIMQGYDSVAMDVDIEIGGNDQMFNMLAGRTLMKDLKNKEKYVLTCKLLTDPTGKKMGKSEGNMITLADKSEDMFGKIMSWSDGMILPGFELCTSLTNVQIQDIQERIDNGDNPMLFKKMLAKRIVLEWKGEDEAEKAEENFNALFQKKEVPDEILEFFFDLKEYSLIDLLVDTKLVDSKSEARRQIKQGAVRINQEVVNDEKKIVELIKEGLILQKGKRSFVKVSLK